MPLFSPAEIKRANAAKRRYFGNNPYGTLGPSPGRVAAIQPYKPPPIQPIQPMQPIQGVNFMGGFGGGEPNWAALIAGDPEYEAAEAEVNALNKMQRGSLRDSIRRAVVESGLDIAADEDVDEATRAAARANQFSSAADIATQLRRGSAQSDAELAARGILSSGQFTENRGVLQRAADLSRNTLQQNLLGTIATGRQQYAGAVAERQSMLRNLRASVAARLAQNPGIWQSQQVTRPGAGIGDAFAPLANASAQQMWNAINSPSVRKQNAGIIARGYDDFLRNYGHMFGGGGGATTGTGGADGAPQIVRYGWENGVQYGYDAAGRRYTAAQLGARF